MASVDGNKLLLALLTQDRWIIRTVERVAFVDRNTVRRRIVRHFTLPAHGSARPVHDDGRRCVLPVFSIQKGTFISCDLRDAADTRIALRPIEERWELTFAAVMALLVKADPDAHTDRELTRRVRAVIEATHHTSGTALADLRVYARRLAGTPLGAMLTRRAFGRLIEYLSKNFLVFADVDLERPGGTHIITYMVDRRFPDTPRDFREANLPPPRRRIRKLFGLAPHVYGHSWSITGAGSSHLEIEAPGGVDFGRRTVSLPDGRALSHAGTSTRHARFLVPRRTTSGEAYARIMVYPGTGVMRNGGPAVGALFTVLLAIVTAFDVAATSATALLLILPSLTSVVAARPHEHPYVTRVVLGVRVATLFPIPLATLATAALAAHAPQAVLWLLVVLSAAATAMLAIGGRAVRARPAFAERVENDLTRIA